MGESETLCDYVGAVEEGCGSVLGYMAVYRLGLAVAVYHGLLAVATYGGFCAETNVLLPIKVNPTKSKT